MSVAPQILHKPWHDMESRHGANPRPTVDLAVHLAAVAALRAENEAAKAAATALQKANVSLQVQLAEANADKSEALDDASLWQGKYLSLSESGAISEATGETGDTQKFDKDKAEKQRVERQILSARLLALYGEHPGADVSVTPFQNDADVVVNVAVRFDELLFAFPRITDDGEFIQVFSRGYQYRLEFPTEQRQNITLVLEACPKGLRVSSEEEFDALCERSWVFMTSTRISQLCENDSATI
jgi:hypothetical protein